MISTRTRWALLALPAVFLGVLFVWPVASIIASGFDAGVIGDIVVDDSTAALLRQTGSQALLSMSSSIRWARTRSSS